MNDLDLSLEVEPLRRQYLQNRSFKFCTRLCMENDEREHKIFPKSGRGLGHVTLRFLACNVSATVSTVG